MGHVGAFIQPYLPKGNRVAIISGPGGPAVSSADACEKVGLKVAPLTEKTKQEVGKIIPEFGTSVRNPVDLSLAIAFDPRLNEKATAIVGMDPQIDMVLIYVSALRKSLKELIKLQKDIQKPIALITSFDPTATFPENIKNLFEPVRPRKVPKFLHQLYQNGISAHLTEQDAAKALAALWNYQQFRMKNM